MAEKRRRETKKKAYREEGIRRKAAQFLPNLYSRKAKSNEGLKKPSTHVSGKEPKVREGLLKGEEVCCT